MIDDFLGFLEYYHNADSRLQTPYSEPLVRIEYDEVTKNGDVVIALLAPFSHAINALAIESPGASFIIVRGESLRYAMCRKRK